DPESPRQADNIDPTAHDLWDTYLPAFRATITEAKAYSIMCAYNAIENSPACANKMLLQTILRGDWGFQGFVTSDCGAVDDFFEAKAHHTSLDKDSAAVAGIEAGTDTNCGRTYLALTDAVKKGLITEGQLDISLRRLYLARFRLGLFDPPDKMLWSKVPFSEVGSPAHASLALKAARASMVLLKNNNTLPLAPAKIKTIAVIGPNAAELSAIEGNYNAVPKDPVMPVDGIIKQFPNAKVLYAQGSPYAENASIVIPRTQFRNGPGSSTEGLKGEYFNNDSLTGPPAFTRTDKQIDFDWNSTSPDPAKLDAKAFSVRWTGTIQAPAPGDIEVTGILAHCYPRNNCEHYTIRFDGKDMLAFQVSEDKAQHGSTTPAVKLHFEDTKPHTFEVTYAHRARIFGAGLSLQWTAPVEPLRNQALDIIKQSDVVVAFVGLSPNLEGEEMPVHIPGFSGGDRTDITLPAAQ